MFEAAVSYVRHMAWLAAIPDGQNQTVKLSRAKMYTGSALLEIEPDPICNWLVQAALECGLYRSTGFGVEAIAWIEVRAWAGSVGVKDMWTMTCVKKLSERYVEQLHQAKDPACPAPLSVDVEVQRETVRNQLRRFIKARS